MSGAENVIRGPESAREAISAGLAGNGSGTGGVEAQICAAFRYIGQSFASCDRCAQPYWVHTHDSRLAPDAGPFGPGGFVAVPITPEQAAAAKAKWGSA